MIRSLKIAARMYVVALLVLGLAYPLLLTGLAQVAMPHQANGSLVEDGRGDVVGSSLIGQRFESPRYFHVRPSAGGYDGLASGGTNLGPTSRSLDEAVRTRADAALSEGDGLERGAIPVDMLTTSASGLDPDITLANAYAQAPRIARERGLHEEAVLRLIDERARGRDLGFIGERRVTVLELNLALDTMDGAP